MSTVKHWEERFDRERAARQQAESALKKHIEIQEELLQSRDSALEIAELKTQFLARMSHEIRTPLNAILGLTGLLMDSALEAQQKEHLGTIRSSGQILMRIISDILDMSKIDAGKLDLEFAPVDLDTLLKQSFSLVLLNAQEKGLQIIQKSQALLPETLVLDGGRLQQIVTNLLSNAVKYSDAGTVTVSMELSPLDDAEVPDAFAREHLEAKGLWQQIEISVADQGQGVAAEDIDELFEPFTRFGDQLDINSAGSSGLGLTISKRISEIMGGDISVQSKLGEGSVFTVRIPCWLGERPQQDDAESNPLETTNISAMHQSRDHLLASADDADRLAAFVDMAMDKPLSVLIADDYDVNRLVLLAQLEMLGYRADAVANGEEVLRALHARNYDVVLMDVRMPVIDGVDATRRIRSRVDGPQPFIAAVTASALKGDREKYLAAGMDAYISKPVDALHLAETLDTAFENRHGGVRTPWGDNLVEMNPVDIQLDELRTRLGPALNGLLAKVIPVYLRELPGRLEKLEAALHKKDAESFAQYCHGLKGTSKSIGARELADLCDQYELSGYDGNLPSSDEFSDFRDLAERTGIALRRTLQEQSAGS